MRMRMDPDRCSVNTLKRHRYTWTRVKCYASKTWATSTRARVACSAAQEVLLNFSKNSIYYRAPRREQEKRHLRMAPLKLKERLSVASINSVSKVCSTAAFRNFDNNKNISRLRKRSNRCQNKSCAAAAADSASQVAQLMRPMQNKLQSVK